ncbi:c-type cytochrome [Solemya velesiana gill symbiont]|uniref:Cytochrome c4 n=1 Tax=Solemya velesiana gill symbiont TaxID=1918948 RepID=A0A1T2KVP2_9GAMM|nr:c-type cytochrome [Solemya velesiana gill symbiont]OOZ36915.1 cytochrome c4 [Solemya velesiana gill symbiont]
MAYKTFTTAVLAAGLALAGSTAFAADAPKLKMGASDSMLSNTCAGCHGTNGASQGPAAPTISGLSKDYFVETMQGFASGEIPSTIMGRIAKGYTDDEIGQMADFYGGKPFVKAKQNFDAKMAKKGAKLHDKYCEKCHGDGGQSAEDDAGVMAGQWVPYTNWQLANFQAGTRDAPKKMKKQMKKMLNKDGSKGIEALLNFYASQQ